MILITGATGLVGMHLTYQLLLKGEQVRAIYRSEESMSKTKEYFEAIEAEGLFSKINWVLADITDVPALEVAFEGISKVYHCAAMVSFDPKDKRKMHKTNIEGTANIVNLCIAFGIKKLCHVSSIATLGETLSPDLVIDESKPWNPELYHSDYAITKYGAEMEVWRGTQEGLDVVIVNPGIILGASPVRDSSSEIFYKLKTDFPFYTEGNSAIVYVNDVITTMIYLMESNIVQKRYTVVSDNIPYKTLFTFIAKEFGQRPPFIKVSKTSSTIAWRIDSIVSFITGKKRNFTKPMALSSQNKFTYSSAKLLEDTEIKLSSYTSYLPEIIEYYKKRA